MRLLFLSLLFFFSFSTYSFAELPAYKIFDADGNELQFSDILNRASEADIIFFGELHNDPIAHWLQVSLAEKLFAQNGALSIGMEMFETDNQLILNEYLAGAINTNSFEREPKLWNNYQTDIKPMIQLAKNHSLPVIATNVPRRYANMVYHNGLDALEDLHTDALRYIVPLPFEIDETLETYANIAAAAQRHGSNQFYLLESQALKDATMAHFILKNRIDGAPFLHLNGSYHSMKREGVVWYISQKDAALDIVTIHLTLQEDVKELRDENHGLADFIITVPSNMTRTH